MTFPAGKLPALLEAMLHISHHGAHKQISGKRLSEILSVPPRFLEPLLQELVKAGVLQSVRGPKGGYCLAREKRAITVADIFAACGTGEEHMAGDDVPSVLQQQIIHPLCHAAHGAYMAHLATYTLYDLGEMVRQKKLEDVFGKEDTSHLHYVI